MSEGPNGQEIQLAHLSFQELLAAEYATAVLQHSGKLQHMKSYFNFLTSSSLAAQSRDRLAEQWWLVVWTNVAEMLQEDSFQEWCRHISSDARSKLKVGRISMHACDHPPVTPDQFQPADLPFKIRSWRVTWMDAKSRLVKLTPTARVIKSFEEKRLTMYDQDPAMSEVLPLEAAHWLCEGVGTLACYAVDTNNWRLVKALLASGLGLKHHVSAAVAASVGVTGSLP